MDTESTEEDINSENSQNWTDDEQTEVVEGGVLAINYQLPSSPLLPRIVEDTEEESESEFEEETEVDKEDDYDGDDDDSSIDYSLAADVEAKFHMILNTKTREMEKLLDDPIFIKNQHQKDKPTRQPSTVEIESLPEPEVVVNPQDEIKEELDNAFQILAHYEISKLQDIRDSLMSQRELWATQKPRTKDDKKKAKGKLCELEESMDLINAAIDLKREALFKRLQPQVQSQNGNGIETEAPTAPTPAELVTDVDLLTAPELRRLLSKSLAKNVEMRLSSQTLKRELEQFESSNEKLVNELKKELKLLNETIQDYQTKIHHLFSASGENGAYKASYSLLLIQMDNKLEVSRKKQFYLKRTLTELMVRHGYLVNNGNGAASAAVACSARSRSKARPQQSFPQRPHFYVGGRERGGEGHSYLSQRRKQHGRIDLDLNRHEEKEKRQRYHREVLLAKEWEEKERRKRFVQQAPAEYDVWREKRKLIIQQVTS